MAATGRRRGFETVGDMVRSLAVVLGVVLLMMALVWRSHDTEVKTVDYRGLAITAQEAAPYPVYVPTGLVEGENDWRATSVRYDSTVDSPTDTVWHIGFVTPSDDYAGLDETDGPILESVARVTSGATPTEGTLDIIGLQWSRYVGGGGSGEDEVRALVAEQEGAVIVVSGTASWAELEKLAGSLRVQTAG